MVNVESSSLSRGTRNRSKDDNKIEECQLNRSMIGGEKRSSLRQFRKTWLPFEASENINKKVSTNEINEECRLLSFLSQ